MWRGLPSAAVFGLCRIQAWPGFGTLVAATHYLAERGAKDITAVCILGAPEGLKFVEENLDPSIKFKLVLCAVDEKLNDKCYIVPGLGDAGDRLYGVID